MLIIVAGDRETLGRRRDLLTPFRTASELRQWAERCAAAIAATTDEIERRRLLAMRQALIDLAQAEDWLQGRIADRGSVEA